ncbi:hypothetical protein [Lacrimispora algidixylanolytica]|uniref:Uncharacterized protein n=1 Tax=Lacrimispora algidixylanolytica TaxID=94868 RepID=A0A419SS45_9FIRM|nr:hypothetical protein [Lacrimispora algidixylanolytica]RKD28079.1 hypothetical protein BET01_11070 [Lacrimispora algidixylanolytica]
MWGKGGFLPYRDYIGKAIHLDEGSITFERLEDVVKYLYYEDDLIIFGFSKGKGVLPEVGYEDNFINKGCYDTCAIYVEKVLPFSDASTVDFIYSNSRNVVNFYSYCNLAARHLEDRDLFDAAKRWRELSINEI